MDTDEAREVPIPRARRNSSWHAKKLCVFEKCNTLFIRWGYTLGCDRALTYAYNSLTYQLPDRMKQSIGFGKLFHGWACEGTTENAPKVQYISHVFANYPILNWKFQFLSVWITFDHLKTASARFTHHRLKIWQVIEYFYFQSLMQHLLCRACCKKVCW